MSKFQDLDLNLEENTIPCTPEQTKEIDDALGVMLIDIRLPKSILDKLNFLSNYHKTPLQRLICDILHDAVLDIKIDNDEIN